tara:strand:- start:27 stop:932 length:906 start_codon:yes stop_codon:yes gene_type:complete
LGGFFGVSKGVINYNATTAPDGTNSAGKYIVNNGEPANSPLTAYITLSPNTDYTLSLFVKKADYNTANIRIYSVESGFSTNNFDLSNGTATDDQIEDYGNGWYRVWTTLTTAASVTNSQIQLIRNAELIDGTSGIYIYGAQLEQGSYPTSYIPTYSVSATRAADIISNFPSSNDLSVPSDSWTILWDLNENSISAGQRWFDDTQQNIQLYPTAPNKSRVYWRGIGQYIASGGGSKIIARYDGTTATEFHDGVNKGSASYSGQLPFDFYTASSYNSGKWIINKFMVFPTALSDADCITLTTI